MVKLWQKGTLPLYILGEINEYNHLRNLYLDYSRNFYFLNQHILKDFYLYFVIISKSIFHSKLTPEERANFFIQLCITYPSTCNKIHMTLSHPKNSKDSGLPLTWASCTPPFLTYPLSKTINNRTIGTSCQGLKTWPIA